MTTSFGKCLSVVRPFTDKELLMKILSHLWCFRSKRQVNVYGCSSFNLIKLINYQQSLGWTILRYTDNCFYGSDDYDGDASTPRSIVKIVSFHNTKHYRKLISTVDQYQLSERAGPAIVNVVLKDVGYLSEINTKHTVCKNKWRKSKT